MSGSLAHVTKSKRPIAAANAAVKANAESLRALARLIATAKNTAHALVNVDPVAKQELLDCLALSELCVIRLKGSGSTSR